MKNIGKAIINSILIDRNLASSTHTVTFNDSLLKSGVYFYRIDAEGKNGEKYSKVRKMILAK